MVSLPLPLRKAKQWPGTVEAEIASPGVPRGVLLLTPNRLAAGIIGGDVRSSPWTTEAPAASEA